MSFHADERQAYQEEYVDLSLTSTDFNTRVSRATDLQIRQYISQTAYWVGYRLCAEPSSHWVNATDSSDLEYLGVGPSEIDRAIWLLKQQGHLEVEQAIPSTVRPTAKLVESLESVARLGAATQSAERRLDPLLKIYDRGEFDKSLKELVLLASIAIGL